MSKNKNLFGSFSTFFAKKRLFCTKKCFSYLGLNYKKYIKVDKKLIRPSKTYTLVGNTNKAKKLFGFKNKTNLILEPFDEESLNFCKKFKKKVFIKLPTTECDNLKLVKTAIINFKKVFLNISGYKFETIKNRFNRDKITRIMAWQGPIDSNKTQIKYDLKSFSLVCLNPQHHL